VKASIISFGKFHAFDLARELKSNKISINLYSSYPYFIAKSYGLNYHEHHSFFLLQIIDRLTKRKISNILKFIFAKFLAIIIRADQDFIIAWSDTPNFLIKILKRKYKSLIIIERGSTHILFQNKILKDEYKKINKDFSIYQNDINTELINYKLADFISIPSIFVKNTFISQKIDENKLLINPYGANIKKFYYSKNNLTDKFIILTVGSGDIRKGLKYIIDSHKYLNFNFLHYHIGNIDIDLQPLIKKSSNFINIASVNQDKLRYYYCMADVFVLASLEEGLSLTILEAMACKLPIIATRNTGIESINSKHEFKLLIEPRNPKDIAEKINYLNENTILRNKLSQNALKTISKGGFTWSDYGIRYYKNLIKLS
jgi:glycosyltransferase involved in cell wall biosynthesis